MVLHRGGGTSRGMAPLEAIIRMATVRCIGAQASGVPRLSRVDGIAPLGRYRTIPETRMQLYSNPLTQTVDPRHFRGRPSARSL